MLTKTLCLAYQVLFISFCGDQAISWLISTSLFPIDKIICQNFMFNMKYQKDLLQARFDFINSRYGLLNKIEHDVFQLRNIFNIPI